MIDVARWLAELGLSDHAGAFAANGIGGDVLRELTDLDLKELGLNLGDRKRLLRAIVALDTAPPTPVPVARREAERRQLTVMFVDLVGSTALSARLDPEAMREVLRGYQNAVAGEVSRLEGLVAKLMGDGVLAYFGWPQAHEDDAERSVRAGLAIVAAVGRLTGGGEPLACRVGIATGLVVVGDLIGEGAAQEEAVVGDTPNLAARLQALAAPGTIVVADGTRRLLGDLFVQRALGSRRLKGIAGRVSAFAVLGEQVLESRFAARGEGAVLPLFGREQELALLLERWRMARSGEGQLVLLTGEAGLGKSRLTRAVADALAAEPHLRITQQASPYHGDSALHPTIRQLVHAAAFAADEPVDARLDKLEALLGQAVDEPRAVAPLFAALLDVDGTARYGPLELSPQQQRSRTLQALVDQLLGLARRSPVLLLIEDAHWIDPTSLELIELMLERIGAAPVLVLVTARPGFVAPFRGHPMVTRLTLNRLGREATAAIVARITGGRSLPEAVLAEIAARTDGVPLFVEELTKTIVESGMLRATEDAFLLDDPLHALAIPTSLHDSLMARLDRLLPVKQVAQTAAAIGREFDHGLLAVVAPLPEAELLAALDHLVEAELVFRRGAPPDARYLFKHALVRDAAYGSLLKSRRHALHGEIARAIEEHFPQVAQAQPELLARHLTEAGLAEPAIPLWQDAGERAARGSANAEAIAHFRQAIALIETLPASEATRLLELHVQIRMMGPLITAKGYAGAEAAAARARTLARDGDAPDLLFSVLYGQWVYLMVRAEVPDALEVADRFVQLADARGEPGPVLVAHRVRGLTLMWLGRASAAQDELAHALSLYDPERHEELTYQYGQDPKVAALAFYACALWQLGYPDRAAQTASRAVNEARRRGHANTLGYALAWGGLLYAHLMRDAVAVGCHARELAAFAEQQGMAMWLGYAQAGVGWSEAETDGGPESLALIRRGLAGLEATDTRFLRPFNLLLLAEAELAVGATREALATLDEALAGASRQQELWLEPELRRRRGLVLLDLGGSAEEAEASLVAALDLARHRQTRSWELRAATSLARLWAARGERQKARDLLAPIHGWFTEGFATPNLIEAKELLEELGQ